MRQPRIIGLDVSTASTGLAMPDGTTRTIKPRADSKHPARRLNEILSLLDPYLRLAKADLAVIEGYSQGGPGGAYVMLRLAEVGGAVRLRLFELGVPYVEVPPSTLKKYATGFGGSVKRKVTKDDMVAAARESGVPVANGDEADAWWLHAMGRSQFSSTWEPLFRCVELLDLRAEVRAGISWPVLEVRVS
jgi:crossover junction endodeoxyribonuclease RuvC